MSLASETPEHSRPTPSSDPQAVQFARAVEFTRLVHLGEYGKAGALTADNSPAARYLAQQTSVMRVYELEGESSSIDPDDVTVTGDPKTGAVKVELTYGDKPTRYTWKDFQFAGGKVSTWTGKSGPIDTVLWHKTTTATSRGVNAKLISAYRANNGNMLIVVELASPRQTVRVQDATYTPRDGYRQEDSDKYWADVDKGEKTLTMFTFENAKFGGKLRIQIDRVDPDDSSSSYTYATLTLGVS